MGDYELRAENVSKAVKGFALQQYKLKQVLLLQSSSSWEETYYRENPEDLTAKDQLNIKGVPRGAAFPHVDPSWTKHSARNEKYAAEGHVFMEDRLTDAIDVQARTILRVARAIAKAVDDQIYSGLSGATGIQTAAAVATWDSATVADRDPIRDILTGIQAMDEHNYDAQENGYLLLSPKDYRNLMMNSKVINNPSFKTADVVSNGKVGQICGLTIIKTNSVEDDEAMIIIGQRAATWKSVVGLTSAVIEDKGIKFTIRSWEIGHLQVTDPKAIYVITNTQS
ncbi:MAG: encapsulin [Candidatus Heimdallarchaeota archaeon]